MFLDFLSLLAGCIAIFSVREPGLFRITLLAGVVFAGLCWYVCAVYTRLWNKRFHVTLMHHVLCVFASLCTLGFVILFPSLFYTKDVALASVGVEVRLLSGVTLATKFDGEFGSNTQTYAGTGTLSYRW